MFFDWNNRYSHLQVTLGTKVRCFAERLTRKQGKGRLDALTMENFEMRDQLEDLNKRLAAVEGSNTHSQENGEVQEGM